MRELLDINADLAEGFGNWSIGRDEELIEAITTANVACGFHASDPLIMEQTIRISHEQGVVLGAHPGLPDLMGFGRRRIDVTLEEIRAYILYQMGALKAFLDVSEVPLHHVKPHGALYGMINGDPAFARQVIQAIAELHPGGIYYWPAPTPDPVQRAIADVGMRLVEEFYVDTRYDDDGMLLVERRKSRVEIDEAVRRARLYIRSGIVESVSGKHIELDAESLCIHGDVPNAPEVAHAVRDALREDGVTIAPVIS